jgi:hypothetical protein
MIWKIWKKAKLNSEKYGKYGRKPSWIVKRYGKYRRNPSWIVKWYGKYGRNASRIVKRFGKYRRKLWKDIKNMEEKYFFLTKQLILYVIYLSLHYALE